MSNKSAITFHPGEAVSEKKIICIAWINHDERTALMAKHLGADAYFVKWGQRKWYMAPLRYIVQSFLTWSLLRKVKPSIIYIQLPPIVLAIVVYLQKQVSGTEFIIDSHSGSFVSRVGRMTQGLHRWLSRRSLLTLVHNAAILKKTENWHAPVVEVSYVPGEYPEGREYPFSDDFNVVFICTYAADEPVQRVLDAARQLPDTHIYITGNYARAPHYRVNAPENVTFTGFLDYEDFVGLLRGTDAIMDLTTRQDTILLGGFESVSLEKPFITSDSATLRDFFSMGTVYVENTAQGIADGIQQTRTELADLQRDISLLKDKLMGEWEKQFQTVKDVIANVS